MYELFEWFMVFVVIGLFVCVGLPVAILLMLWIAKSMIDGSDTSMWDGPA
jgi:hypothetical protein